MVVQHNLRAMNSNRMLGLTASVQSKSTEKLSSGYKINRAADDAAGLSISEKMRKQIRGLSQASLNASDGISAVQTAEGALNEVQDMLQRMNELAVKASNGTMSEDDRSYIQNEISQLETEINRVAETTKFNETYMLKGGNGTKTEYMKAHDAGIKGELVETGKGKATFTMEALEAGDKVTIGGRDYTIIKDAQTEAVADTDYTYKAATNAYVDLDLSGWTGTASDDQIKIGDMAAVIDGAAGNADLADLVEALNADTGFNKDYKAELIDEDAGTVRITALDHEVTADEVEADLVSVKVDGTEGKAGYADKAVEPAESSLTVAEGVKLYAANGDKELTVEEALAELDAGKKVYVDEAPSFEQTEAVADKDYTYAKAYSSVTIDLTGWKAGDTVTIAGETSTASTGTDIQELVDDLNGNETFAAKYEASLDDAGKLVIKSYDENVTAADIKADFTGALINGASKNTAACAALTTENEPVEALLTTPAGTDLYANGGTEALTKEEILAAIKNGDKLFTNSAKREESEITIDEAYEKVKVELLKANQIGDTAGTAKVEFAAATREEEEKVTADDFAAGDVKEIDGTEYMVADTTVTDFEGMLDDIVDAATTGTTNKDILISFTDVNGKEQEFKVNTGTSASDVTITQTKKDGNTATDNIANATALKTALAAAAGCKVTITDADSITTFAGDYAVLGDDDVEGATVVSAEKMAELVNAAATTDTANTGEPSNVFEITTGSAEVANTLTFNLHVGADADMTNKINVGFEAMTAEYLGVAGLDVSDSTGLGATYAVDSILDAIQKVSTQRSALGAVQNRLEHTIANLDNVVENTTAAESQIRDTDMATEMVKYSNNNILAQAGQAMLAQANQANQGVLSLLG